MDELDRWRRRHQKLTMLTDQLKNKECKAVISALIMSKSKLMKRWKVIDIRCAAHHFTSQHISSRSFQPVAVLLTRLEYVRSITDAVNETKDKRKFLESIARFLEQLQPSPGAAAVSPRTLIDNVIPQLMAALKQMDSVSRHFARSGFLGYLFTKVLHCTALHFGARLVCVRVYSVLILLCRSPVSLCPSASNTCSKDMPDSLWSAQRKRVIFGNPL